MSQRLLATTILASALLLAACGGGGGSGGEGGTASAPPPAAPAGLSVEGEIEVAFATAADGDTNDPSAPLTPNDTPETAQLVPNPVTVGGYVNQPGRGTAGRSFADGDLADCYRVALAMGQTVQLLIAEDGFIDDLDLALLEVDGTEVASSDGTAVTETVTAPASGEYVVEVSAFAGASNYVLTIDPVTATASAPPVEPEWVPGELIVRFAESAVATSGGTTARAGAMGLRMRALAPGGEALLGCDDEEEARAALRAMGVERPARLRGLVRRPGRVAAARDRSEWRRRMRGPTRRLAKALRRRADVMSADLNYVRRASAEPADELYSQQWHYPLISLPAAWDNVAADSGVVVAVIDTGVVLDHPDLQGQLVPGYDFIADPVVARDGDGCDADPDDPGDSPLAGASTYHGTHVAGTVAARSSLGPGGDTGGVVGVAWNAQVMPLRVLGLGGGNDFDLMQAVRYAAGMENECGALPAAPADVINMSLSGPGYNAAFEALIAEVREAGLVVIAAAGNQASDVPVYPAGFEGVISVSAVDAGERLAPYSNFGNTIDVAAPGGDLGEDRNGDGFADGILSTLLDDRGGSEEFAYGFAQGTSMASPHVAGVVALMLGVNPNLNPFDIDLLLLEGALTRDIGSSRFFGAGLIDAFAAIEAAIETVGGSPPINPPRLRADPSVLNFGPLGTSAEVILDNGGGDDLPLVVESVTAETDDGAPWLAVVAAAVDAEGLGRYAVSVDRGGLSDGVYTGLVTFASSAGDLAVPVLLQVGASGAGDADAGRHFVLLVNAGTLETVKTLELDAVSGVYVYRFDDVEAGDYLVYAGTDSDNDRLICDAGEACGAYATVDQPIPVSVQQSESGLDFVTGFATNLSAAGSGPARPAFRR